MDLGSLLNQDTSILSIQNLRDLLREPESTIKLNRITNATFSYPSTLLETFEFFDVHVRLLLSIQYTDEAYGPQYTNTVATESLRTCINGLLHQHGYPWLVQFPRHLSSMTWHLLHTSADKTVLMYLYTIVLALSNQKHESISLEEWAAGLVPFVKTRSIALLCHVWMMCWVMDDEADPSSTTAAVDNTAKRVFINEIETVLKREKQRMSPCVAEFISALDSGDAGLLSSEVEQRLDMGLLRRPAFSKDELLLGHAAFLAFVQSLSQDSYPEITSIARNIEIQRRMKSPHYKNPLYNSVSNEKLSSDIINKVQLLREGIKSWHDLFLQVPSSEFDLYLKDLVQRYYPSQQKTMLDTMLAFWTIRNPYNQHRTVIIDALLRRLEEKGPYNRRTSPFYAYTQLYRTPVDTSIGALYTKKELRASAKTGADIDITQFTNSYSNAALKQGCFETLKQLTPHAETITKGWVADCLQEAMPEVVESYIEYLATNLSQENLRRNKQQTVGGKHLCEVLRNPRITSLGAHVVPKLLQALNENSLLWLRLNSPDFVNLVQQYFSECAQLTKQLLVVSLLQTKPRMYMDELLGLLREKAPSTTPPSTLSPGGRTTWFVNHFISALLTVAGDGSEGVASQIFRQILKTRADFIWYLGAPSLPLKDKEDNISTSGGGKNQQYQDGNFKGLEIAKTHEILAIKQIGLVSMFHEMVRLGDTTKTERLVEIWYTLWTAENSSFTVPVSWIMQCTGLYDEAPAVVKQMIERLMRIGIRQDIHKKAQLQQLQQGGEEGGTNEDVPGLSLSQSSRLFVVSIIDLMVLADIPELDTVMDVFLRIYQEESQEGAVDDELVWSVVEILIQLVEELRMQRTADHNSATTTTTTAAQRNNNQLQSHLQKLLRRKRQDLQKQLFKTGNRSPAKKARRQMAKLQKRLQAAATAAATEASSPSSLAYTGHGNGDESMDIDDDQQQAAFLQSSKKTKALLQLVQRALTFLLNLGSYDEGGMEVQARIRLRNKMSEWLLLYEPLSMFKGLLQQESDLLEDLNSTIDVYIQNLLRGSRGDLAKKAQRLLDCNSSNDDNNKS
ncbi:hypothetical protein BDB00DRAFT_822332 [Zychaea mexicana]|uniref:uncharacterized protein n=1 Tax=Zychaea mexicana TaxID=64656 RepID=UPI0022FE4825|nr:uncharacterized protein BDB00DRAFT_822332 [Zychaea mexicana]KAI9493533.1 hypothetical protein BDB00DRAFT_822332 [Zychaea mexicana]